MYEGRVTRDRRIHDSAESYSSDQELLHALLEDPADFEVWPVPQLEDGGFTAGQRALVFSWRLDAEVRNGGFGQYFHGLGPPARAAASEALDALVRFGAHDHQRLLAEALARFDRGMPPDPAAGRGAAEADRPETEEQYHSAMRHAVIGVAGPDLETVQDRLEERRRHAAELRRVFGELDDAYRALGRRLERYWVDYVRAHPVEFFSR